ncbi:MAG: hypothetical protein WC725_03155 [Patescibacteria group bacterium]|jgi:hypothetical protein
MIDTTSTVVTATEKINAAHGATAIQKGANNAADIIGLANTDIIMTVARLIRTALGFVGIIFLLVILQAGAAFLFSGGKEENIQKAKKTLLNGIIGLIVIFLSYSIVQTVIRAFLPQ